MKKLLSILLMVAFVVTSLPVLAEYENIECVESYTSGVIPAEVVIETRDEEGNVTQEAETYQNGTVYTRKVTAAYHSNGTNAFEKTSNSMYNVQSGTAMVYKVALPPLAPNQQYDQLWFNWTSSTTNTSADTLIKYPGENWDFTDSALNSKSESVQAVISASNPAATGSKIIIDSANGLYKRVRQEITAYANDCRRLGQTYMYIGITNASTKKVFGTQGYSTNKEDAAALSFVTGPFSGLLTTTNNLAWTDVAHLSNGENGAYTNPIAAQSAIRYDYGRALFRLPMPVLSETETLMDYKLYFAIHGNSMASGYNFNVRKVADGADYFKNQWTYSEHPFADTFVNDHRTYNNSLTMTNSASAKGYEYEYTCVRLTSYARELASQETVPSQMYVAVETSVKSSVSLKGYNSSNAGTYIPYVEYTIYDSAGDAEGCEVEELKIVPSASDRYQAANVETLTAGTAYRAVVKASNIENAAKSTNLYIATYVGGELDTLTILPCSVDALSTDYFVWSDVFTPVVPGSTVKAFLWNADSVKPLVVSRTANVAAAEEA